MRHILITLIFLLISCSENSSKISDAIIVGTCADNPPFEYVQNGNLIGFDIDLIHQIAKEINSKVVIKNLSFQGLIPALHSREIDLIVASISETEERKTDIIFSTPYSESSITIVSNKDFKIEKIQDLENKILGVQMASNLYQNAKQIKKQFYTISVKAFNSNLALINELILKNVDALMIDSSQVNQILSHHPDLNTFEIPNSTTSFSIAYAKNNIANQELVSKINIAITKLKNDGSIAILKKKWLNQ